MKLVIGVVGEPGAGKGTLVKLLGANLAYWESFRFSDILRPILIGLGQIVNRDNMQRLAQVLVETFGDDALAGAMRIRINASEAPVVLVDGVRWEEDRKLIRSYPCNILVYVTAPPEVRYRRALERGENVGEDSMSYEQFLLEDQAPNERFIRTIGETADVVISNDGTLPDFEVQVKNFYKNEISKKRSF